MAGLVVLGVVLLLGLVLFTPLLVQATREEAGLQVLLHIGPARLRLYPSGEKAPPEEPAAEPPADDYPEGDPFAREDLSATRRISLDELKFGRNYISGEE